jgi:hypothetical protein
MTTQLPQPEIQYEVTPQPQEQEQVPDQEQVQSASTQSKTQIYVKEYPTIPEEASVTPSDQEPPSYYQENGVTAGSEEENLRHIFKSLGAEEEDINRFLADIRAHPDVYVNDRRPCVRNWATKLITATPIPEETQQDIELEHLRDAVVSGGDRLESLEVQVRVLMKYYNSVIRDLKDLQRCVEPVVTSKEAPDLLRSVEKIGDNILETKVRQIARERRLQELRKEMVEDQRSTIYRY